jgi:ribosomal protein L37AE/L43A
MQGKSLVPIPDCRRCGTPMKFGQAIPTAIVDMGDGQFTEGRWAGEPPILAVWKCPKCGHSFFPLNAYSPDPH